MIRIRCDNYDVEDDMYGTCLMQEWTCLKQSVISFKTDILHVSKQSGVGKLNIRKKIYLIVYANIGCPVDLEYFLKDIKPWKKDIWVKLQVTQVMSQHSS